MKIISPSLLNSDTYQIKEQFEALEKCGINYIHIDITDGHFVPMISFGANTVKDLRKHTDFVLDCHLMVENPENLIPVIADAGADIITVHTEATKHIYRSIQTIKKCGKKAGIAINPGTPVSMIKEILPMADLVLCMTTNPGVFGESFIPSVADKVKNLCELREQKGYSYQIQVDGSINDQTAIVCKKAGADIFVSGSYIFGGNIEERIHKIMDAGEKIFLTGKGRSGLAAKGFANRLMHLGFQAYVIGEISTPHTKAGDLLIITSGSGETDALVSIAKKAKESGLYLGLVTMNPQSTLGKMADGMIILPGDSKGNNEEKHSIQPMGSQFEQMSFLIFDAIVLKLMENWNQTSEQMFMRHADLE